MPVSYSWNLYTPEVVRTGSAPDPGPYVPSTPMFGTDARAKQFERGIKFANVPAGRADMVVHGGPRVYHVNSVSNVAQTPDKFEKKDGSYSGVIKYRHRNYRNFPVPSTIGSVEKKCTDSFGNTTFDFTGK